MHEAAGPSVPDITPSGHAVRLADIVSALDSTVRRVVAAPGVENPTVSTVALVETADLGPDIQGTPQADLILMVGVPEASAVSWLLALEAEPLLTSPAAIMLKEDNDTPATRAAAEHASVALVVVDRLARWDLLLGAAHRRLQREQVRGATPGGSDTHGGFNDLAELALVIAEGAGGMVTIERPDSSVLAYSPSDGTADELRIRAILGRAAPADSMRLLRDWGVMHTVQRTRDVVAVPEHAALGMRPRLVTGIHSPSGQFIGSIWLQEGAAGFTPDARTVVRGGASAAARVLARELDAPTAGEVLLQRVFGERGGIDAGTAAALLELPDFGDAAVIGIATSHADPTATQVAIAGVARMLRLHIGAFAPQARFALIDSRAYALLPNLLHPHRLHGWAEQLAQRFDGHAALSDHSLHIAIVTPIAGFEQVARARSEADRVLDAIRGGDARVTSLTQSRTSVLLHEAIDTLGQRPELEDPRIALLEQHDDRHGSDFISSVRAYVDAGFNAREAARALSVHPNTLRYRLARASEVAGVELGRAEDRLLVALQLAMRARRGSPGS